MEFIKILLQNSSLRQAKLYNAAKKAAENPAIGITIQNKAAFHVIKDCATITTHYLPHFVFGAYEAPFETLRGKFKKAHVTELIQLSEKNAVIKQLVTIIIDKAIQQNAFVKRPASQQPIPEDINKIDLDDPYGDYGSYADEAQSQQELIVGDSPFDILCQSFKVTD
jgi:hypothetical protein